MKQTTTQRKTVIELLRVAGYHGDTGSAARIYIQANISPQVYRREFARGQAMKRAGVVCVCADCKQ